MFYREAGDYKTTYVDDNQTFPIKFDRYRYYLILLLGFAIIPFVINDYWVNAIFLPFLIYAIAAIGLNILTGYCGQVSLGTGGFMAVGAYSCYKFMTGLDIWLPTGAEGEMVQYALPPINIFFSVLLAGFVTALVGGSVWSSLFEDQGVLSGRGDVGGAVLSCLAPKQVGMGL